MNKRKTITDQEIVATFDAMDEIQPDSSTELLLSMTADALGCSYERVVTALGNSSGEVE